MKKGLFTIIILLFYYYSLLLFQLLILLYHKTYTQITSKVIRQEGAHWFGSGSAEVLSRGLGGSKGVFW